MNNGTTKYGRFRGHGTWDRPYQGYKMLITRKPDSIEVAYYPNKGVELPIRPEVSCVRIESVDGFFYGSPAFHKGKDRKTGNVKIFAWVGNIDPDAVLTLQFEI
jgi:hypothetical protein